MMKFFRKHLTFFTAHKIASVLFLAVIVIAILELTNTTHFFHKSPAANSPIIPVQTEASNVKSASQKGESTNPTANEPGSSVANSSQTPATVTPPYGSFVSNHSPQISSATLNQESSVCNTSPNTSCYISFSKDSVTKSLPTQTTDSSGTTSWSWDVKSAGLSPGDWTITAVAGTGSNAKTKQDSILLKVSP